MGTQEQASARWRPSRWSVLGWIAVGVWGVLKTVPIADASHTWTGSDQLHVANMHIAGGDSSAPVSQDEEFCVVNYSSQVNTTTMADFIRETLTRLDFSIIWDGTGNWRIDLWRTPKFCNEYTTAERDAIEIEYRIKDSWTAECWNDDTSCVHLRGPVVDSVNGHTRYRWGNVHLKTAHVMNRDTTARSFINHETGHVWGLKDPGYYGDCMNSVMHNHLYRNRAGCTDPIWYPSSSDFTSVKATMDRRN